MKILTLFRAKKYGSIRKIILLFLLALVSLVLFLDITWSYHNFEVGFGTSVAEEAIAYHIVLLLGMVAMGIGLGLGVDRMICQKRFIFRTPRKGSWTEALMNIWGYELKCHEESKSESDSTTKEDADPLEHYAWSEVPTRRGRKPTFTLERWLPIAAQWENRDPIRDAFTLGELICEHLGTNPDGSPIVSEQTYYSIWRPRAIEELRRRAKSKTYSHPRAPKDGED